MLKLFAITLAIVLICVIGLSFNILRGKEFPETEVSSNKEMRRRGITCAKQDEMRIWRKNHGGRKPDCPAPDCSECGACNGKETFIEKK
ncbi:MAG: hypothetical protein MJY62_03880 [Bacteroidales bacterium]|nr:hypothetical protein [Bacteroidales bacterium]